jgi:hypothetical protein
MTKLLRWICDPHTLEAIEGDLAELYGGGGRASWRYVMDVVSICVRQPRTAVRSLAAAFIVLALVGPPPVAAPIRYTVHATDPAGAFALEIHHGRAVSAALDGAPVRARDLVQAGDTLIIRGGDHGADFRIAIKPEGGITWYPRHSVSP